MSGNSPTNDGAGIDRRTDTNVRAYLLDPDASRNRLSEASGRLFSREECRLGLCSLRAHGQALEKIIITDPEMFSTSLIDISFSKIATLIFYIHQSYTWSSFEITQDLFNALMSYLDVYPTFLDIVQLFGEKPGPLEE
ncbi:hypothetical protein MMC29_004832, partial [Sticta canariensis]|nr:hypothetical protein [Sticta canariensis]